MLSIGAPVIKTDFPSIIGIATRSLTIQFDIVREYPFPLPGGVIWTHVTSSGNLTLFNSSQNAFSLHAYVISSLQKVDQGIYVIMITNIFGSATASVQVTVQGINHFYFSL